MNAQDRLEAYQKMIREFRRLYKQPTAESFADYNTHQAHLYSRLIQEEWAEYDVAECRTDIIDALADLTYVVFGGGFSAGIQPEPYKGIALPCISHIKLSLVNEVARLSSALTELNPCHRRIKEAITFLYWKLEQSSSTQGFDLLTAFQIVHQSNLSKLWTEQELQVIPAGGQKETAGDGLYIVRRSDGKIIKSPSFNPPDLSNL